MNNHNDTTIIEVSIKVIENDETVAGTMEQHPKYLFANIVK